MMAFVNSLSFPMLFALLFFVMCGCFVGAYRAKKKGNKAETVLGIVFGISTIPAILFRFLQEYVYDSALKDIGFWALAAAVAVMMITVCAYGVYRYRTTRSETEKQKLRAGFFMLLITIVYVVIMVIIIET